MHAVALPTSVGHTLSFHLSQASLPAVCLNNPSNARPTPSPQVWLWRASAAADRLDQLLREHGHLARLAVEPSAEAGGHQLTLWFLSLAPAPSKLSVSLPLASLVHLHTALPQPRASVLLPSGAAGAALQQRVEEALGGLAPSWDLLGQVCKGVAACLHQAAPLAATKACDAVAPLRVYGNPLYADEQRMLAGAAM